MSRNRLRSRQRTQLTAQMRIVIGTSIFALASFMLLLFFNIGDVKDSRAFSSGDFRSAASGNWNDVSIWEVYDGDKWSEAAMPPGSSVKNVLVTGNQEIVIEDEVVVNNLIIDEGSALQIDANEIRVVKQNGKGGIVCNGKISFGSSIIFGDGDFTTGPKATISIGSEDGIDKKAVKGNLQLTGKKEFNKDALYIFSGTIRQHTGNGIPSAIRNIVFDNSYGVELDQSIFVADKIILKKGIVSTGKYSLAIGASPGSPGEIERISGTVSGKFKRWYGPANIKEVVFPMSDGFTNNVFSYTCDVPEYQKGMIEMNYQAGILDESKRSPFDARHFITGISEKGYFSTSLTNGSEEAWLKITSAVTDKNENKISWKITKRKKYAAINPVTEKAEKISSLQNLFCGPNPFTDRFFVRFYSDIPNLTTVQVMNGSGQEVYSENMKVVEGNNQFEYMGEKDLPPGIYIIRISNSSEIHTLKIVKEK